MRKSNNNENILKIATVFSGIGAPEQALKKLGVDYDIVFACDNDEIELNKDYDQILSDYKSSKYENLKEYINDIYTNTNKHKYVKQSYFANYEIDEDRWYPDIRFLDGKKYKNHVDLYIGGSPCQSFSIIGKRGGLEDTRGTLFYEYARLIKEIEPKVFIYENVPGMLMHDKGNTWKVIRNVFESLGYNVSYKILNSKDYGIPQDRKRLFVVGIKNKDVIFEFPKPMTLEKTMFDYLEDNVDPKHYLGKKGFEFVTNPKYKNRARVNKNIIQTEKANQQFNWNGDFVFEELEKVENNPSIMARAYVGEYEGKKGVIRQLSYRECMRLMGFSDDYKIVVPNVPAYRQAGNSIVVNVMEEVIKEILKVVDFDEQN
jgi:DNA (cytosine-5)-methyltransferase 1